MAEHMTAEQLLDVMADQLGRAREQVWHECECEDCPQCGRMPHDCSGTECAATCQCSTCDFCVVGDLLAEHQALAARLSGMVAVPPLNDQELRDLRRFAECCEDMDAGGHDVPKARMKRLEAIGVVCNLGFGRHQTTEFGDAVLNPGWLETDRWQPIWSAPKSTVTGDGRVSGLYLLGFVPDPDAVDLQSCVRVIWWEPLMRNNAGGRGMWVTDASDAEAFPTHWRELPAAPEPPHV